MLDGAPLAARCLSGSERLSDLAIAAQLAHQIRDGESRLRLPRVLVGAVAVPPDEELGAAGESETLFQQHLDGVRLAPMKKAGEEGSERESERAQRELRRRLTLKKDCGREHGEDERAGDDDGKDAEEE